MNETLNMLENLRREFCTGEDDHLVLRLHSDLVAIDIWIGDTEHSIGISLDDSLEDIERGVREMMHRN